MICSNSRFLSRKYFFVDHVSQYSHSSSNSGLKFSFLTPNAHSYCQLYCFAQQISIFQQIFSQNTFFMKDLSIYEGNRIIFYLLLQLQLKVRLNFQQIDNRMSIAFITESIFTKQNQKCTSKFHVSIYYYMLYQYLLK